MAKLESLIVDLQLNTAELRKGLDESNAKLTEFGKKMHELGEHLEMAVLGEMAIEAAKKLGEFVIKGAETQEKLGRMAQAAGVSVEEFSRLNYAAGMSGVSTEALGTAFKKLNGNISDAATGSAKQTALFNALGVSVKDSSGHVRTAGAVMKDLAEAFSGMRDGASKTKLEMALFGKTGDEMTRMLNRGKEGLTEFEEEADRLGVTVSGPAAESAELFMENIGRLRAVMGALSQQIAANLSPSLAALTDELLKNKDGMNAVKETGEFLSNLLRVIASGAVLTAAAFQMLGTGIAAAASAAADYYNGTSSKDLTGKDRQVALLQLAEARQDLTDLQRNASQAATNGAAAPAVGALVAAVDMAQARVNKLVKSLGGLNATPPDEANPMAPLEKALERISAIWDTTSTKAEESEKKQKKSGDAIAKAFADGTAEIEKQKKALSDLAEMALKAQRELEKMATAQALARERSAAGQSASNDDRTTAFNNIGAAGFATTMKVINSATAGFTDFQDALAKLTRSTETAAELHDAAALETKRAAELTAEGTKALSAGLHEQADALDANATAALANAQRLNLAGDEAARAAEKGSKAADAFGKLAEIVIARQQQVVSIAVSAIGNIGKTGNEVAKMINGVMEGFKSGGIIGAFVAVIIELFSKLASVGKFIDDAFSSFMEVFGQLDSAFSTLFSALSDSLVPVMKGLGMTFSVISRVLTPIFSVLETIMKPFEQLANSLLSLLDATGLLDFVVKIVAGVFNVIGMVVGSVILGIQYLWAGILRAVRAVISIFTLGQGTKEIDKTIAEQDAVIEANKRAIAKAAANIGDSTTPSASSTTATITATGAVTATGPVTATVAAMAGTTMIDPNDPWSVYANGSMAGAEASREHASTSTLLSGGTDAEAEAAGQAAYDAFLGLGTAAGTAAASLTKFSQSLTNVPQGFKYAINAFNSMAGGGTGQGGVAGDAGRLPGAVVIENFEVHGSILSENDLANLIAGIQARRNFRRTGSMLANNR